jgi:hypothetical protein
VIEPVGDHAQCERLYLGASVVGSRAVGEHARKLDDLGDPASIGLAFDLDRELHRRVPGRAS